jgi:hypothetical protein
MPAIFQFGVRKLIGKLGVPYNRGLRVRGSLHPHDYGAVLPPLAAESKAFRIHRTFRYSHEISDVSALAPVLSPGRGRIVRRVFENFYDCIGRTPIRKTRTNRKLFPLPGKRIKGEAGVNTNSSKTSKNLIYCSVEPVARKDWATGPTLQLHLHPLALLGGLLDRREHALVFQAVLKCR